MVNSKSKASKPGIVFNSRVAKSFLLMFMPLVLAIIAIAYGANYNIQSDVLQGYKSSESVELARARQMIIDQLQEAASDLRMLMFSEHITELTGPIRVEADASLISDFKALMDAKYQYDQIRYIDAQGMEVIRVDFKDQQATAVQEQNLQDMSSRYYFLDTMKQEAGTVFVSPLDLNVEQGEIELPFKPVLRIASPLVGQDGQAQGMLIVNYLAETLLSAIKVEGQGNLFLLNEDGYYMSSPDSEDEWGFMFKDDPMMLQRMMSNDYPDAWSTITSSSSGQFTNAEGLFTFDTIWPAMIIAEADLHNVAHSTPGAERQWKIVFLIPHTVISAKAWPLQSLVAWGALLCFVTGGASCLLLSLMIVRRKCADEELHAAKEELETLNQEMLATNEMLERVLGSIPVSVFWKDTSLDYQGCNLLFAEEAGLREPSEIVGMDDHAMPWTDQADLLRAEDAQVLATCKPLFNREVELELAGGKLVWVRGSKVPMLTDTGEVAGILSISQDVSQEKQAQDELAGYAAQMNSHVAQMELKNLELDEALFHANAATLAKSEFLAKMSHEIRTPMNGVLGMTELLLDTNLDKEQLDFARTVHASGNALLEIINDILDFSKIEAGKLELEELDFDLRGTGESVLELLAFKASEKNNELVFDMVPELPSALIGDPGRIRQILLNLVGNAIKFTKDGEIVLRVSIIEESPGDVYVRMAVHDSGIGIPEDKLGILFESFSQVDSSTNRKFGGTGLGLAISKQLAELMGGEIGVESDLGIGSTFWVTARLQKGEARPQAERLDVTELKGLRVLVVDDTITNLLIIERQLAAWGMMPEVVTSGEEALCILKQRAEQGFFAVALLDHQMPGMDGEELARRIKADPNCAGLPLVMITSCGTKGDAARMKVAGFCAYLTKPLRQTLLLDCLVTVLGLKHMDVELERQPLVTKHSLHEATRSRFKILLAEDNAVNQKLAVNLLTKYGYSVEVACDGLEALKAVMHKKYDLVLMDCMMPQMDGYEATHEIRKLSGDVASIPIIAMTAHAMAGEREKCLQAGMDDYVSKPIDRAKLFAAIERQLGSRLLVDQFENQAQAKVEFPNAEPTVAGTLSPMDIPASIERSGSKELWDELIGLYNDETATRLAALADAIKAGNAGLVEREAHTIKGSSAEMLAEQMRETASELEVIGNGGDLGSAPALLVELRAQFDELRSYLESNTQA